MNTILKAIAETPWAILPAKLEEIILVAERHAAGVHLSAEEIDAIKAAARRPATQPAGVVAVLPLYGSIFPRANLMTEMSGATSAESFQRAFKSALADPNVSAIVLDVDSPGGAVQGVSELADTIFSARGQKPVVALANHLAASAAYWIASSADELMVTPSGEVGSIGVFALHEDWSRALDQAGVTPQFISAGKFKTEGNPYEPLGDAARAAIQGRVDEYYEMFTAAVARGRGVKASDVRAGFGEGRVVGAAEALRLGMVDRIGTLDAAVARADKLARASVRGLSAEARARRLRLNANVKLTGAVASRVSVPSNRYPTSDDPIGDR
jgi:signal peptide peptidase SppA